MFLHWRLKIFIWCNYQLLFVSVHSRTNLFAEIQVSYFHTIKDYICVHHYHGFMLYFSSFYVFTLHISVTTNYDQLFQLNYSSDWSEFTQYLFYFLFYAIIVFCSFEKNIQLIIYHSPEDHIDTFHQITFSP